MGNKEARWPSLSSDGRFVAFYSTATNLVAGDINGQQDIFVKDRETKDITRVSVNSSGVAGINIHGTLQYHLMGGM